MDPARGDDFDKACHRLRQISRLKEKARIDDAVYKSLEESILLQLHQSLVERPRELSNAVMTKDRPVAYGAIHEDLVKQIEARYRSSGADSKQRMLSDMTAMADHRALNLGDSEKLTRVVDVVSAPLEGMLGAPAGQPHPASSTILKRLADTNSVAATVRYDPETSPAAKAIAETAQQSVTRAADDFDARRHRSDALNTSLKDWWHRQVVADVEGAFQGGAAAAIASPAFALGAPWAIPMVAAFGVVVGAGIRSGIALAEG